MPPSFFRYNYIIDASGSIHGKSVAVTVHAVFFSFSEDDSLAGIAEDEAIDLFEDLQISDWFEYEASDSWEIVDPSESRGIGFYYLHVLLDDQLVKKVHLRHRQQRISFYDVVSGAMRSFLATLFS